LTGSSRGRTIGHSGNIESSAATRDGDVGDRHLMIRLQILLRENWRHDEGVRLVQDRLKALGLNPTAAGRVTVSAEATPETFRSTFGHAASRTDALSVPPALVPYVASISIAPGHVRMDPEHQE
jgi:hypothetical protein